MRKNVFHCMLLQFTSYEVVRLTFYHLYYAGSGLKSNPIPIHLQILMYSCDVP